MYLAGLYRLLPSLRVPPMPAILDVGSGTGLNLIEAARLFGPARILAGIDISPGMVSVAQAKARALGLPAQFVVGDAEQLPYGDATFDLVICNSVFHWFRDRRKAMAEMARVLRRGGQLALITATAPGFGEWFALVDGLVHHLVGGQAPSSVPDLPTGLDVGHLMSQSGFLVERLTNPTERFRVRDGTSFVGLMSVIAPHWAADLPEEAIIQLQHMAAEYIRRQGVRGFPVTWSAVEAIGTKV